MENNNFDYGPFFAIANIKGNDANPEISGTIVFKRKNEGVLVTAEIFGLPKGKDTPCGDRIFAFHIHNGSSCTGNEEDSFADADMHFNPNNCKHPEHAGDLPPLFSNNGYAYLSVFTNKFNLTDIIGKVIIIHDSVDDFTSQPSGNSGNKIACGKIMPL